MQRFLLFVAVMSIACVFSIGAAAEDTSDALSRQYRPALETIRQAYNHATIKGTFALSFPKSGGMHRTSDFVYRVDGPRMRLDEINVVSYADGAPSGIVESRRHLLTPETSVWAYQGPNEPFDFNEEDREACKSYIAFTTHLRWTYLSDWLTDILSDPDGIPDGMATTLGESTCDGRRLVNIRCNWTPPSALDDGTTVFWQSDYQLSPSESWALREALTTSQVDGEDILHGRVHIDYSGMRDGVPLVKRIVEEISSAPQFEVEQRLTVDVSDIVFASPEAHIFTREAPECKK